jgi:hypothetical protein
MRNRIIRAAMAVGVAAFVLGGAGLATASAAPSVRMAPSVVSPMGNLTSVSASAVNNGWAVGCHPLASGQCPAFGADSAYHFNGRTWKAIAVPMPVPPNPTDSEEGQLNGVATISATDAWAVGTANPTGAQIAHWNGKSWKQVSVPALPSPYGKVYALNAVSASSASNMWAVGSGGNGETIALHWNGKSWKRVRSPNPGTSFLNGVVTTSNNNAWAVGTDGGSCSCTKALIERWNGKTWKVVFNGLSSFQTFLTGVAASSASNAWAVGLTHATVNIAALMHWNGKSWKRVTKGAGFGTANGASTVFGVATTSAKNAWAVGSRGGTKIMRFNGASWKSVPLPAEPGLVSSLAAVAARSASNAWAVGSYTDGADNPHAVILHWNGKSWKRVAA